ncbi:heme anaerobic degradation radical SAM methyltransferase ChuW/HutW [Vibrio renipiscarius]|uniref:Coproporphyrinogen III oxidase n=1 Tax=Vibrio renipiscarius TaxID=1461322 RepID=A0A0C2NZW3_9VIBR|nr:heme anaerobic degradation radical SAM methyltransferase ChuW/HutW [Vibrio renipiscarius]KII79732.1 coproporphyrinogen III oxidase [Vibrio renipiscarius]KII80641.1 coproporphyrinogen III oxidase [Vibrio renipiscarius]
MNPNAPESASDASEIDAIVFDHTDESIVGRNTPDPLRFAFSGKTGPHVGGSSVPVPQSKTQDVVLNALNTPATVKARCLYIHIPFCRVRCTYCNFFQYASSDQLIAEYFAALVMEIERKAAFAWTQSLPFQAVYVGGGTPTDLSADQIKQLGQLIRTRFPLTPDCEITLEGRVNRFSEAKFESALEGGFNRFSLGVQSFDSKVRRAAKRLDDGDVVLETLQKMVRYNAAPIVIDLLYGLPHQTLDIWQNDLEMYIESGVDGVDLYQLLELQNLPMARLIEQGKLPQPANTATKAQMYQMGADFMARFHQRRLSVNHWASTNRERSIYNSLAKTSAEVLPIGAGAGGNFNGISAMQHRDMTAYIDAIQQQQFPIGMAFKGDPNARSLNQFKAAFDRGALLKRDCIAWFDRLMPLFEAWQDRGLVTITPQAVALTQAGQFWSVNLASSLIKVIQNESATRLAVA